MNALLMYHGTAILLLTLGLIGFIRRKSLVGMLISVELMLNGAGLALVASGQLTPARADLAHLSSLLVMGLAAAEATLVLAIILVLGKRFGASQAKTASELKG